MKVILQQDVKGQGKKGPDDRGGGGLRPATISCPRKLAIPATADAINTMKLQEKAKKARRPS